MEGGGDGEGVVLSPSLGGDGRDLLLVRSHISTSTSTLITTCSSKGGLLQQSLRLEGQREQTAGHKRCLTTSPTVLLPQHQKRVVRGYRGPTPPRSCGVVFEDVPLWLWSLRASDFTKIWVTPESAIRLQTVFWSTWVHFETKLVISDAATPASNVDVWFVSGSWDFLEAQCFQKSTTVIMWLFPTSRRKPANSTVTRWTRIAHSQVGGTTTMSGVFGFQQMRIPFTLESDPILRTIDHILKYSERPIPCSPDWSQPHYRPLDRISVHRLDQPVVYPSYFSRTGWGYRQLLPMELGHAFDLPPFVLWEEGFGRRIVPVQLLRVIADQTLASLSVGTDGDREMQLLTCRKTALTSIAASVPGDRVYLEGIQKWLPGNWADGHIADRAVKADNARIDFSPWHRRISLVLPCSDLSIERCEKFNLRCWRRALFKSFVAYLIDTYGANWEVLSRHHRVAGKRPQAGASNCASGDGIVWGSALPSAKKRRRLEYGSQDSKGGIGLLAKRNVASVDLEQLATDLERGRAVLSQVLASSWWDWKRGSSLLFWRWNGKAQCVAARDGIEIFVQSPLPQGRRIKSTKRVDTVTRALVSEKIVGMLHRSYLETGFVSNALHFFAVPKGDSDVRVVFDGTSSGLNETLWCPNFYLPTARAAALNISYTSWMSDMDCGEMFHNFPMDKRIRKCAGLQMDQLAPRAEWSNSSYLRWSRLFMGMRPSPYLAVRHYYWAEEFAKGDPSLKGNPMGFNQIVLNLPGMLSYDPSLPKVMKWNEVANAIAGDVITFVDDIRISGFSKENCWAVHRQFASRIQYLGMQDAPRKFRPPSQHQAGAWTGTIFRITSDTITKSVSSEKWIKGTSIVRRLGEAVAGQVDGRPMLNRKMLERETGFLNHLSMTFEQITPYLKGFYLSLNSWRLGRDLEDWKVSGKEWNRILIDRFHNGSITEEELEVGLLKSQSNGAPLEVRASPRFASDIRALNSIFMSSGDPPKVSLRSRQIITVIFGFGDASGSGLGSTFTCGAGFTFRIGIWGSSEKPESSNWKEFTNVVEALEEEGAEGNLVNAEIFMFTDNSTVEACASKGSSTSKKLLDLIIRLQTLTTRLGIRIHIFHVAGTRMIAQGTDGVSRGYLAQGVMAGESMRVHIPIYLSAVERSPKLLPWIMSWTSSDAILLDALGWFQKGHDIDGWRSCSDGFSRPILSEKGHTFIWSPPPFAAEVALAELRKARIKRQTSSHVFICPRLCMSLWQRQLFKCADFVFEVPAGSQIWSSDMHEPLLIGLLFPFLRVKPWQLRGTPKMHAVGRELRSLFQDKEVDPSDFLRKFWRTASMEVQHMPERVVWRVLHFK
jgi:hypothetical protein